MNDQLVRIRQLDASEYALLPDFLYEAVFQPQDEKLPRSVIEQPALRQYIEGFGSLPDDHAMCAVVDGRVAGIAWVRCIEGYGYLDDEAPELSMSILPEYRGQGIGSRLLSALLERLAATGYERISLSVQAANKPALGLYRKLGFHVARSDGDELILVYLPAG